MNEMQYYNLHKMLFYRFPFYRGFVSAVVALALSMGYPLDVSAKNSANSEARHFKLDAVEESLVTPDFSLPDRRGINHRITDYTGHVVVINFWSTWCIPCRKEMPALERAWQRLKPSGAILLSIAMQDDVKSIDRFLENSPVSFPVLLDSDGEIARQWRVIGIPVTFILSPSGQITYKASGIREWDSDEIINKILDLGRL